MFSQETELIIKTVHQRTISNQPAIAVKDILAADIPYPLKTFLRTDVELILLDELHRHRKTSRFNFEHPEIQNLQTQMSSVLVLNFSFERVEFLRRIDDTVHLIINYLLRPQWTLTNVLFEKERSISTTALTRMLRYFGPYEYLKDIIARYVQEKHVLSFERAELVSFLWKVDGEYIRRKTGDEVARIMSPIYEFLDFPQKTGTKALPIKGLMKFFEDKGMTSVLHRLEGEFVQGKVACTRLELGNLMEDVRRTSGAFEIEPVEEKSTHETRPVIHGETKEAPKATETRSINTQPPVHLKINPAIAIDDGDRRKFIKKIFLQDDGALISALHTLHSLATWKQASVYIDEIFIRNNVDPYCSEAKRFIEVVYQQYYPKK